MGRSWQIAAGSFAGFFGFAFIASLEYPLFDELGPGPAFFPIWLSLVGIVLCAILIFRPQAGPGAEPAASLPDRRGRTRLGVVLVAVAVAAALLEPLGFRLTMLLFLPGLLLALGARSPLGIASTAICGSLGVFHVFYYWLKVPLPIGGFGV